jgi:hypothetical protein
MREQYLKICTVYCCPLCIVIIVRLSSDLQSVFFHRSDYDVDKVDEVRFMQNPNIFS